MPVLLEACLDSVELARAAERGGAGRIELCDRLDVGGTTPNVDLIRAVVGAVRIPVFAMIRPRGGSFVHTDTELEGMRLKAASMKALGIGGVVVGVLRPDHTIDAVATRSVVEASGGLPVTFHLAFEQVPDRRAALETLAEIGISRLLTRGGGKTALDGVDGLRALVDQSAGRVVIMAGGSVREGNVAEIVRRSGVTEVHSRGLDIGEMVERANAAGSARRHD